MQTGIPIDPSRPVVRRRWKHSLCTPRTPHSHPSTTGDGSCHHAISPRNHRMIAQIGTHNLISSSTCCTPYSTQSFDNQLPFDAHCLPALVHPCNVTWSCRGQGSDHPTRYTSAAGTASCRIQALNVDDGERKEQVFEFKFFMLGNRIERSGMDISRRCDLKRLLLR